ncbi:zinc carboxypeptidase A 1-like, partial [Hyposmocoma kahamanoa]|uniref:zinc carboxypeptidase A 1-like n=1 Tax=Hyposmocoma kahamanoa TaxID=1477025 RepID=UPI000E6D91D4
MTSKTLMVIILFVINFRMCCTKQYDKYTLFSVKPTTKEQLQFLQNCALQKYFDVKFWNKPHKLNNEVQMMLDTNEIELFSYRAQNLSLKPTIITDNVQKIFDRQTISKYLGFRRNDTFDWKSFYALEDIYTWLKDLSTKYEKQVVLESIGKSNEGRDIYSLAVRKVQGDKEIVIVEGGAHGNEWISVAFVTYLIHQLLESDNHEDVKLKRIAGRYHWYLIPVLNPDGYEYNQKTDRMWRKNRRQIRGKYVGVDLNRNFEYRFGKFDTSTDANDY